MCHLVVAEMRAMDCTMGQAWLLGAPAMLRALPSRHIPVRMTHGSLVDGVARPLLS